ncbi:MAG: exo-alpha-sialidase [Opitutaceae bacterium]|nr:exo-alpha-sialidase [Opitutaceae bacterium]
MSLFHASQALEASIPTFGPRGGSYRGVLPARVRPLRWWSGWVGLAGLTLATALFAQSGPAYSWRSVQISGGGFVSGLLFHPAQPGLLYARTDVGGVYRWNGPLGRWLALNDAIGGLNNEFMNLGVLSFAVDANDPNRLYLACGQYVEWWAPPAILLRSEDRGATWRRTSLAFKLGGNQDGRNTGERLQVDPNDGRVLFLGTTQNGLWRSGDRGETWAQVPGFAPASCTLVLFDRTTGSAGSPTQTLYAGVASTSGPGLLCSTDSGTTWREVPGQPAGLMPHHAEIGYGAAERTLYLASSNALGPNGCSAGAVWKLDLGSGIWTAITPVAGPWGWGGLSVAADDPRILVASTLDRWGARDDLFRSTNAGATWTSVLQRGTLDHTSAPWAADSTPHWTSDVKIDPFDSAHVLFVTGYGVYASENVAAASPAWAFRNSGLEETVPLMFVSPPVGPSLVSVVGDVDGFRHDRFDLSPASRHRPLHGTNRSIDFAGINPALMVRTFDAGQRGAWSADGGATWTDFARAPYPTRNGGVAALGADGATLVWSQENSPTHFSTDSGGSWSLSAGAPVNPSRTFAPVADRVAATKFYLCDPSGGRVYCSTDRGASFVAAASVPTSSGILRAVPGLEGNLWLPCGSGGLRRSADSATSFAAIPTVQEGYAVGFGKAAPGQSHPAVFLWGRVADVVGFFRSDDAGATWVRINDDRHQYGAPNWLCGDPRVFGRLYLAASGRGIIYGEMAGAGPSILTPPSAQTVGAGSVLSLSVTAEGAAEGCRYRWLHNGSPLLGATTAQLQQGNVEPGHAGFYTAEVAANGTATLSPPALVGVLPAGRTAGAVATRAEWQDIHHPNGNTYDQFLLTGTAGTITADAGQIARLSFLDEENSIVQVEMSGPGAVTVVLTRPSGPAAPVLYNQAGVSYMQGAATVILAGAEANTFMSIYSVGRVTNPGVTRPDVIYNGWANVRAVGVQSVSGGLGGLFLGNVLCTAETGPVGLLAPSVSSVGTVNIHEIMAWEEGQPSLVFAADAQVGVKITGGSLLQLNSSPIGVSGLSGVQMVAGQGSSGQAAPGQPVLGRLVRDGVDLTAALVGGP